MIAKEMITYVENSSVIRKMFEEGNEMAKQYGAENVFDFSLGNPSVEPPKEVKEAIISILNMESPNLVHGYMNNSGFEDVREAIALSVNEKYNTHFSKENILMTVGAAGGLNVIFKTLLDPEDEVITFAPYFGEYRSYVKNFHGKLIAVSPNTIDFQPNLEELEQKITKRTKAVLINTPNNPTGVVYTKETLEKMADILLKKEEEYKKSIYLISDEPYRELVYDGVEVPYVTHFYHNAIVGYSYSKSLSLPGERIGYLVLPDELDDFSQVVAAANVANRILGFVNAPSLQQRVVARCLNAKVEVDIYNRNRELLYEKLTEYGYECVKPQGAFYLWVKMLGDDESAFVEAAKKHNILVVPGSAFGCAGYVRIAYCVDYEMIERALPGFESVAKEYKESR
ncbi:biosynthetic aromatic amino acid aminotransferase alpha [Lachnospiraceae bacterium KM106-2]|nr:biosynthetic aromatic amino acid aminotransferase alpha [Lachnospiraceae bacterium KM106-2]